MNGMGHVAEFEGIVGWESVELKGGGCCFGVDRKEPGDAKS